MNERLLKALILRPHRISVAQMPFAKDARAIAGGFQHFGDRHFVAVHHGAAARRVNDASAIVIAARQSGWPRRRANGADVEPRQLHTVATELIERRRLDFVVAIESEVTKALIVAHDRGRCSVARRPPLQGPMRKH